MLIVTNLQEVNQAFEAKAPRPYRDVMLEKYPDATEDCNGRFHAPYDGYECPLTGKYFRAGEYLPDKELEDDRPFVPRFGQVKKFPKAVDLEGNVHTWDGTRAQNRAVWEVLYRQTKEHEAANSTSTHLGEVGQKITLEAKIQFVKEFEGFYGLTYIHIMKTGAGDVVVYRGSKILGKAEETIALVAKVKDHGERDGIKQTIISHPKVKP